MKATTLCTTDLTNLTHPNDPVIPVKCADDPNFVSKDFEYIQNCNTWSRKNCTRWDKSSYCVLESMFKLLDICTMNIHIFTYLSFVFQCLLQSL